MSVSTVTSKGQTTIPKNVREYLKLHPGDKIDFIIGKEGKVIIEPTSFDVKDLKGVLSSPKRKPVSVEEMKAAVRKRIASKIRRK
ncbi:MAG: type II toxin-antitoxin system PrlF family antitoxin [Nitrospirae bacterium]|nr:type II toxin-antitoxin system PrlF family antitoxin [Nitrospirota bacterium]